MTAQTRMAEQVARAITAVTDNTTGHYNAKAAREEIRARIFIGVTGWVDEGIGDVVQERTAAFLERQYLNGRKPHTDGATLFDPTAVLPLGDGDRVFMDDATAEDLAKWAQRSAVNADRVITANRRTQQYAASRIEELHAHPGWNLGRLEREVHDWTFDHAEDEQPEDE